MRHFKSIYSFIPIPAVISEESEVKRDESLTISQIISLHSRGIPANVHIYESVQTEIGLSDYRDEHLTDDFYEMENDLSDFNPVVSSAVVDDDVTSVLGPRSNIASQSEPRGEQFAPGEPGATETAKTE